MDAPLARIFWSLQAGAVLACGGFGILIASSRLQGDLLPEAGSVLFAFGLVVLTVGAGFLVSSAISYFLSQRLGLVRPLTTSYSGEGS
jgi:dipeptide/tripeptide permease